jgi:hypothetical protein
MRVRFIDITGWMYEGASFDAFVTHPDGKTFFRIDDMWFPADMCELVE